MISVLSVAAAIGVYVAIGWATVTIVNHLKTVKLTVPPGWDSLDRGELREWEGAMKQRGYKEEADCDYRADGLKSSIGITHFQPEPSSVFSGLPDTEDAEEMRVFIEDNRERLQEYINERYSITEKYSDTEMQVLTLDCGHVALALRYEDPENDTTLEYIFFMRKGAAYRVYVRASLGSSEEEEYVVENLRVK